VGRQEKLPRALRVYFPRIHQPARLHLLLGVRTFSWLLQYVRLCVPAHFKEYIGCSCGEEGANVLGLTARLVEQSPIHLGDCSHRLQHVAQYAIHFRYLKQVLGGTLNCGSGSLEIRTTALAGDSAVARMAKLVEEVRIVA